MLTVLALVFIVVAIGLALGAGGSPRGAFDVSRERLRADAHKPSKIAPLYLAVVVFIGVGLVTGATNWAASLFALVVTSAFLTAVFWIARR